MFKWLQSSPRQYRTPAGTTYDLFDDMAAQPHLLVAGATGSGKSVVVNGIVFNLLHKGPASAGLVLLDPKGTELIQYKDTPHCIQYAWTAAERVAALETAMAITEKRFSDMRKANSRKYAGGDVYVIIDELADMMTTQKKDILPLLQRLCQIGRAARVHVIACTQCPLVEVIPTAVKVNFDARVALRTRSAQDSRNILGRTGCEILPRYGQGYYMTPEGTNKWIIPYVTDDQIGEITAYWTSKRCWA